MDDTVTRLRIGPKFDDSTYRRPKCTVDEGDLVTLVIEEERFDPGYMGVSESGFKKPGIEGRGVPGTFQQFAASIYPLSVASDESDFGFATDQVDFEYVYAESVGVRARYAVTGQTARLSRVGDTVTIRSNVVETWEDL